MSTFDVRKPASLEINKLLFSDGGSRFIVGTTIGRNSTDSIFISAEQGNDSIVLESVEQVQNLIKALNKAVELGWVE